MHSLSRGKLISKNARAAYVYSRTFAYHFLRLTGLRRRKWYLRKWYLGPRRNFAYLPGLNASFSSVCRRSQRCPGEIQNKAHPAAGCSACSPALSIAWECLRGPVLPFHHLDYDTNRELAGIYRNEHRAHHSTATSSSARCLIALTWQFRPLRMYKLTR